ncbi:MAG: SCO7613 C-terminal domain-containing membrane protein [Actinomycetota bacterium]
MAAAITALWVAATQLWIVIELTPRWVTFAVVGLVLVWLAATYERQQRRAVGLARHLRGLR